MQPRRPTARTVSSSASTSTFRRPAPPPLKATASASAILSSARSPPLPSSSTATSIASVAKGDENASEGNIQVVVRCRGFSAAEKELGLPSIASCAPTRGTSITLSTPGSTQSGGASGTQTKAYTFGSRPPPPSTPSSSTSRTVSQNDQQNNGNIFGPLSPQSMLYFSIAQPILEKVLSGFNCTIFAYGQTGTGKTYTMEGDLEPFHGTFGEEAGLIPRVLWGLFDRLSKAEKDDGVEWSVRASFVELYNEELRDLNAGEDAAEGTEGLRIFDEGKSGVVIQGLEETLIGSAEEGLRILKRGSERRQMAKTRCNDQSSRSHSIFTLQIHTVTPSSPSASTSSSTQNPKNEEIVRVGKLNLVDLAGSENVGRSGADKGKGLREAGMINVSLLALGRVINKLVEEKEKGSKSLGNAHIPYRESKLTRLLRDSLGGRTLTTIIATISPVNAFEDTASTLDYALRAKSIQNKPEANARMTKMGLLKEYQGEIERLRDDLAVTRAKNGHFLSPSSWETHLSLQSSQATLVAQLQSDLLISSSSLLSTKTQFEQNLRLLELREEECRGMKEAMERLQRGLEIREEELRCEKRARREAEVESEAREEGRKGWLLEARLAREDAEGLRAKIERKKAVEATNRGVLAAAGLALRETTDRLARGLDAFGEEREQWAARVGEKLSSSEERREVALSQAQHSITTALASLSSSADNLIGSTISLSQLRDGFLALVDRTREDLLQGSQRTEAEENAKRESRKADMLAELERVHNLTLESINAIVTPLQALQEPLEKALGEDQETISRLEELDLSHLAAENERLRRLVDQLSISLEAERSASTREDSEILQLLESKLAAKSRRSLTAFETVTSLASQGGRDSKEELEGIAGDRKTLVTQLQVSRADVGRLVNECTGIVEDEVDKLETSIVSSMEGVREAAAVSHDAAESAAVKQLALVAKTASTLSEAVDQYRTKAVARLDALAEGLQAVVQETRQGYSSLQVSMVTEARASALSAGQLQSELLADETAVSHLTSTTASQISLLRSTLLGYLDRDIAVDVPSGSTPQKRPPAVDVLLPIADLDAPRSEVIASLLAAKYGSARDPLPPLSSLDAAEVGKDGEKEDEQQQHHPLRKSIGVLLGKSGTSMGPPKVILGMADANSGLGAKKRRSTMTVSVGPGAGRR